VRDLGSKLDEELSSFVSSEILLDLASVIAHGIVHVDSQEMVLIEFLFARKNIEDQRFHPSEEYGHMKDRRL
jgi:hypothetical protein